MPPTHPSQGIGVRLHLRGGRPGRLHPRLVVLGLVQRARPAGPQSQSQGEGGQPC
jgi:hypothetical protein